VRVLERTAEVATITAAARRAAAGEGSVLLVSGEAGIGKTTLVRTALGEVQGVGRWVGGCDPLGTPRPLGPWLDMAAREPALAAALDGGDRVAVEDGVLELLRDPRVVVVEDVHWVDEATADLLLFLGRRIDRSRSVLVLTYRPWDVDVDDPASRLLGGLAGAPAAHRISLAPLSEAAVATLAEGSGIDAGELHDRTGGNAFYVTEVLADPGGTVPTTVAEAVRVRLAELPPEARRLLDLVALAPGGLELDVAAAVLGEQEASRGLDAVGARGMARLDDRWVKVRHELARVALEELVPPGRRRELHVRLLETLERRPGVDVARLVHHAVLAGDRERVLDHAPTAAAAAAHRGAHRAAAAHLRRAIEAATDQPARSQAELWDELAAQHERFDERDAVIRLREQVVARWQEVGDAEREARQRCLLAGTLFHTGARVPGVDQIRRARELVAGRPDNPTTLYVEAMWLARQGHATPAREHVAAWEQLGERSHDAVEARLWSLHGAAQGHVRLGNVERSFQLLEQCVDLAGRTGQRVSLAETDVGAVLLQCRRHDLAEPLLQAPLADHRRRGSPIIAWHATALLAQLRLERGRWDEARGLAASVVDDRVTPARARAMALAVLARLDAHEGQGHADHQADEAWDLVRDTDDLNVVWPVAVARAESAWAREAKAPPSDVVVGALALARRLEDPWAVGELAWWARQAAHDVVVDVEVAEPWALALAGEWAAAADAWESLGCPLDRAIALTVGDVSARRQALDLFIELGATADADRLRQQLRAEGATGLPARARPRTDPDRPTRRQLEVLELVAEGLTNAAIAERLFISEKTVGHHVSALLDRLGARTRTQAVAIAADRGILGE
jgi:DNA-binding CsgD family transcriptional regulator/tetratricopeptide (TPR) repeat protein